MYCRQIGARAAGAALFIFSLLCLLVKPADLADAACARQAAVDACLRGASTRLALCRDEPVCTCWYLRVLLACYEQCRDDPDYYAGGRAAEMPRTQKVCAEAARIQAAAAPASMAPKPVATNPPVPATSKPSETVSAAPKGTPSRAATPALSPLPSASSSPPPKPASPPANSVSNDAKRSDAGTAKPNPGDADQLGSKIPERVDASGNPVVRTKSIDQSSAGVSSQAPNVLKVQPSVFLPFAMLLAGYVLVMSC
ncbi:hypothetical protein THASP1DRAFT_28779 [Thamnocephalis sphaerospora]|uniref:Extracellular membrane protein CFEM domain-containing protein n=1 Tax=Thamnocephalis sphaerospora TaxID=78915 RepID=A0A4P9XTG5_9FUNG|nr:hypothetical protein THASP1DRAFT_28779 [Thamnocephalis sphaerospora]|eukprot:RKP09436.1 hypothetical protein THASP1DRAFT_28779 [Thamnocephalis sphaerospora]